VARGAALASPKEGLAYLLAGAGPVGQPGKTVAIEGDDRDAIRRGQQNEILLKPVQHPVAVLPDRVQVVDEDEIARAHRFVVDQGRDSPDSVFGSAPRVASVDLREVTDRDRFAVDQKFEVVRFETADPIPLSVRDDSLDVDDTDVDHVGEQVGQGILLPQRGTATTQKVTAAAEPSLIESPWLFRGSRQSTEQQHPCQGRLPSA